MFQSLKSRSSFESSSNNSLGFRTSRLTFSRKTLNSRESSDEEEDLEPFLNKTWDVYNVSPLYRLEYSDIYLKRCAKWLREKIVNYVGEKKKDFQYIVKFSVINSLKLGGNNNDYLKIVIETKLGDIISILYEGIFLATEKVPTNLHSEFKYLPTLIARCNPDTANIVHGLLQNLFDCKIYKLYLSTSDFKWFIVLFCTNEYIVSKSVSISYNNIYKNKDGVLNTNIPSQSLINIWNRVRKIEDNFTVTTEEVEEFHSLLNTILKNLLEINVERLHCTKIKMSNLYISYPFKFKVNDPRLLKELLVFQGEESTMQFF